MKKDPEILITGATGLVGAHLVAKLSLQGNHVRAIFRKSSDIQNVKLILSKYSEDLETLWNRIEWVEADITDIPSLESVFSGIKHVYHCAALVSFDDRDFEQMCKVNIEGTANMVNLSLLNDIEKFCYVSSIATLSTIQNQTFIDENNSWNGENEANPYAITKNGAEMEVWRGSEEGLNTVIVNPGVIIGGGFWNTGSGKLFKMLQSGFRYYTRGSTGFIDVKDVVKTMIYLMQSDISKERFILVSENLTYKAFLDMLAESLQVKKPTLLVSTFLGEIAWRIDTIKSKLLHTKPNLTASLVRSSQQSSFYNTEKIQSVIDFSFQKISNVITDIVNDYQLVK